MKQSFYQYNINDNYNIKINVNKNPYDIELDNLFCMAARKNLKRKFLFVSKVLGKHVPIDPKIALLTGRLLSIKYIENIYGQKFELTNEICDIINGGRYSQEKYLQINKKRLDLPEETLIIGFAETATALGHSFFDSFENNAFYLHTTRDIVMTPNDSISFEEEHSHATSHRLFPLKTSILKSDAPIVFVDDEITTGKTTINIIESIQKKYPRKRYCIVSILDWRSKKDKELFKQKEEELGIKIDTVSLISGEIAYNNVNSEYFNEEEKNIDKSKTKDFSLEYIYLDNIFTDIVNSQSIDSNNNINTCCYLKHTGRFGIDNIDNEKLENLANICGEKLKNMRTGSKTLCLGTEEFMYIPMKIATYMGVGIKYHSTTRSPIYASKTQKYGVQNKYTFKSPNDNSVQNFVYNIPKNYYDDIFVFLEREGLDGSLESFIEAIKGTGVKKVYIVTHATSKRGDLVDRKQA
ncbi:phosphoribosyltransferase family protein [Abyssisolibacter fermentans]|uniref:phosphoribosyltransferase family protein n=1 Tax=Abyssisolibacter fermentans TaxID=1766203 RepID=UPI00082CCCD0|nr:phosphoribosyltransferase family protein [Abyssisolibacter fermentans]